MTKFFAASYVVLFTSLQSSAATAMPGFEVKASEPQMAFRLSSQDGERVYSCTHKQANSSGYDWDVTCGDAKGVFRSYGIHMLINVYTSPVPPKMKYEVLFWVTARDLALGHGKYVGSTIWFNLNDPSALNSIDLSQDVEEIWSLQATIKLTGATLRSINPAAFRRPR